MHFLHSLRRFRTRRRDRFAFSLFPRGLKIKHHEHPDDSQERADPFQEPARVAQNLDAALLEIMRVPGCLRNFVGQSGPSSQLAARITERMVHATGTGAVLAVGIGYTQSALEPLRAVVDIA